MMEMIKEMGYHGSDLEKIEKIYGIGREDITSFSSNVNPLGLSPRLRLELAKNIDVISTYPDRDYVSLRSCIGEYVGADYRNVIVGNGSTEIISSIIRTLRPNKSCLISPTYSEYEREIALAGGELEYYYLKEADDFEFRFYDFLESVSNDIDLLVLCNPNNPTSTAIGREEMRKILDYSVRNNIFVMIDETYVEFAVDMENVSSVPLVSDYDNLIVIRGISKFFAAPGLRLGYAVCSNSSMLNRIEDAKNPWSINSLAAVAGEILFQDQEYINDTKDFIAFERERICRRLTGEKNIKFYKPVANFVLVQILNRGVTAASIFETAIKNGLLIRDCSTFPTLDQYFLRFCFMMPDKNDELIDLLIEHI